MLRVLKYKISQLSLSLSIFHILMDFTRHPRYLRPFKPDPSLSFEPNKENQNSLNTLRPKIPPLQIPINQSPQSTCRYPEQQNSAQIETTKRNLFPFQKFSVQNQHSHQSMVMEILDFNNKHFLKELYSKMHSLPINENPLYILEEIENLLSQETEKKVFTYQEKLFEVVAQIQELKRTITEIDESYTYSVSIDSSPSTKLRTHLDDILSSIKKQNSKSKSGSLQQISFQSVHDSLNCWQPECPWNETFEAYKWIYKFCLELFTREVGLKSRTALENVKSVYEHFRNVKAPVEGSNPCECVLRIMDKCNQSMSSLRNDWLAQGKAQLGTAYRQ